MWHISGSEPEQNYSLVPTHKGPGPCVSVREPKGMFPCWRGVPAGSSSGLVTTCARTWTCGELGEQAGRVVGLDRFQVKIAFTFAPRSSPVQRAVPQTPAGPVRPPGGALHRPDGVVHRPVHPPRLRAGDLAVCQVRARLLSLVAN